VSLIAIDVCAAAIVSFTKNDRDHRPDVGLVHHTVAVRIASRYRQRRHGPACTQGKTEEP